MAKPTIAERKAALDAQYAELREEEKLAEKERFLALGAGLDAVFSSENSGDLKNTVLTAIEKHLKNNQHRHTLGFKKLATNRGRKKQENDAQQD